MNASGMTALSDCQPACNCSSGNDMAWQKCGSSIPACIVFRKLHALGEEPAFLSGCRKNGECGRYSIIAVNPQAHITSWPYDRQGPFDLLERKTEMKNISGDFPPVPFVGGWLGYFSYELLHRLESIKNTRTINSPFPEMELSHYNTVLTRDNISEEWTVSHLAEPDESQGQIRDLVERYIRLLENIEPSNETAKADKTLISSNFTKAEYLNAIGKVLSYISAGDIYQVNLAQRFGGKLRCTPAELMTRLAHSCPAPFGAFYQNGDRAIISASPERFLRVNKNHVETHPIKGTRPRGETGEEDRRLLRELIDSEKEKAELNMITDLLRNDLGKVCEYGSVKVSRERAVETFSNVHHTYSIVEGNLRKSRGLPDLLRATLPGGSITGAPKLRATEIIAELEPDARGPYCGAIGYIGADGNADLNIAIRTIVCNGNDFSFHVGGGIVADSDPQKEYEETLHKAEGILKALNAEIK